MNENEGIYSTFTDVYPNKALYTHVRCLSSTISKTCTVKHFAFMSKTVALVQWSNPQQIYLGVFTMTCILLELCTYEQDGSKILSASEDGGYEPLFGPHMDEFTDMTLGVRSCYRVFLFHITQL